MFYKISEVFQYFRAILGKSQICACNVTNYRHAAHNDVSVTD